MKHLTNMLLGKKTAMANSLVTSDMKAHQARRNFVDTYYIRQPFILLNIMILT
jgi:hypothetical protein